MYGLTDVVKTICASVENFRVVVLAATRRSTVSMFVSIGIMCIFLPSGGHTASSTVNVYLTTSSLLNDFIGSTTNQYLGTLTPSPYFANTYNLTLTGKNPAYLPPMPTVPPSVSTPIITLDAITRQLTTLSTWTYVYGMAEGMQKERRNDLTTIGYQFSQCLEPDGPALTHYDKHNCEGLVDISTTSMNYYSTLCSTSTQFQVFATSVTAADCKKIIGTVKAGIAQYKVACSSPDALGFVDSAAINCQTGLWAASQDIYQQNLSTPTVLELP